MPSKRSPILTRSKGGASSAASAATKPPAASSAAPKRTPAAKKQPQRKKAATKTTGTSKRKGKGRGRKPSSAAASTPAAEIANLDDLPILTPDVLVNLSEEDTKATLQTFFTRRGIDDVTKPIDRSMKESLSACFRLETSHVNKLLKMLAPGCTTKRSKDILILVDSLRKGLFPAKSIGGIPRCSHNKGKLDDISLRSTFADITCLPPQGGNDWTQDHLIEGITKQIESVMKGEDYHFTKSSNAQLARTLEGHGINVTFNLRWRLVKEMWIAENPGRNMDYTPNPLRVRNTPVNVPATPAPSISGSIGSDVNANAAVVVPPTPIQGNQQNGNAVAPPPVDTNLLLTMLMEQQRRNEEERRRNEEDMKEERRRNEEERRRNDEERLRNDDKFQAQSNQMVEQNNKFASLQQTNTMLLKEIADNVKPRLNTLETNQAGMRTEISGLQANHATLETNQAGMRTEISDQKEKIDFLLKSVKKIRRYSFGDTPDSKGGTSVNNDDDESLSESLGRRFLSVNLKSHESPQQEILSGGSPERATAAGARRSSDDQSEENVSDNEKSNDSWKLDDEDGIDVAEDDHMESDDNSEDDDSTLSECDECRDQQAQTFCSDKNCRRYFRLTGSTLF